MIKTRPSNSTPTLRFNERWFVVLPGRHLVQEAVVMGTSDETVLLQTDEVVMLAELGIDLPDHPVRYFKKDVRWIELVRWS